MSGHTISDSVGRVFASSRIALCPPSQMAAPKRLHGIRCIQWIFFVALVPRMANQPESSRLAARVMRVTTRWVPISDHWSHPGSVERLCIGRLKFRETLAQLFRQIAILYCPLIVPFGHDGLFGAAYHGAIDEPG